MDELQQKIVELQNQINELSAQINNGLFSNTILQSKNLIQASGAMTSPNFLTNSAGWSLDALGNLEANNGKFRGDITASAITGSTITGGTIQTATTGQRVVIYGTSNSIIFYDSGGDKQGTIYATDAGGGALLFDGDNGLLLKAGGDNAFEIGNDIGVYKDMIPTSNKAYDLGVGGLAWRDLTCRDITADSVTADISANNGASGSFTTVDLQTVTVENGIITDIS